MLAPQIACANGQCQAPRARYRIWAHVWIQRRPKGRMKRLAGKIGIVTAAASGMGRAGALRFAREGGQVAGGGADAGGGTRGVVHGWWASSPRRAASPTASRRT